MLKILKEVNLGGEWFHKLLFFEYENVILAISYRKNINMKNKNVIILCFYNKRIKDKFFISCVEMLSLIIFTGSKHISI